MTTAVLVVDVQRAFVEGAGGAVVGAERLLRALGGLLTRARAEGVPVVHLQEAGDPLARPGTAGWELALPAEPGEMTVAKRGDDAFEGTDLADLLAARGVGRVVVVGLQSEMCVAATARGALARGLEVVLPRDGHATYDVTADDHGGVAVPADQVVRVAERSLGDVVEVRETCAGIHLAT